MTTIGVDVGQRIGRCTPSWELSSKQDYCVSRMGTLPLSVSHVDVTNLPQAYWFDQWTITPLYDYPILYVKFSYLPD